MKKAVIEIDSRQLLHALEQLPSDDLKKIIDTLFAKKLLKKPAYGDVASKAKKYEVAK